MIRTILDNVSIPMKSVLYGIPNEKDVESLSMYGYFLNDSLNKFIYDKDNVYSTITYQPDCDKYVMRVNHSGMFRSVSSSTGIDKLMERIIAWQDKYIEHGFIRCSIYCYQTIEDSYEYVEAKNKINRNGKNSTWDYTNNMVRVRSSNIYSYSMRIPDGSKVGDLFVQFKNKKGGPGDIYQYFEFPVRMWQKFISTGSKGHFFWKFIRNVYRYRKLTGDKRGKLANAIN